VEAEVIEEEEPPMAWGSDFGDLEVWLAIHEVTYGFTDPRGIRRQWDERGDFVSVTLQ
jgi:hypothetical protein